MRYLLIILLGITIGLYSCEEDIEDFNVDPKAPTEVDPEVLFTYGQYNLVKQMVNIDYNHNVDRLWANYLTQTTYIQEASYDAANRDIGGSMWDNIFTECLIELSDAKTLLRSQDVSSALEAQRDNKYAMVLVLEVFAYQYLVDNFGPIPYTENLDVNNVTPAYDDGEIVYSAIADSLDRAISMLDENAAGFSAEGDILYGGDIASWQKFANSLKLKMGMRLADYDEQLASQMVSEAESAGVFTSNADNAVFNFIGNQPYTNPIYDYFFVDNRNTDFVVAQRFIDMLEGLSDPRMDAYFDDNIEGGYVGGEYGAAGNAFAELTHIDPAMTEATYPGTIMDYAFVSFTLAEAVERGFITGDAAEYYENGIRASFEAWGLSSGAADAYIAQPDVDYSSAPGDYKQKIGMQKYIALYNQGHEAWTEARRLDYPELATAASNGVANPNRMIYPTGEVLINTSNYRTAEDMLGDGDKTTSRIFWDVN